MPELIGERVLLKEGGQYWGGFFVDSLNLRISKEPRIVAGKQTTYFKTHIGFIDRRLDVTDITYREFGGISRPSTPSREQDSETWSKNECTSALYFLEQIESYLPYNNEVAKIMIDFLKARFQRKSEKIRDEEERIEEDSKYYNDLKAAKKQPLDNRIWLPPKPTLAGMMDRQGVMEISESNGVYAPQTQLTLRHHGILKALEEEYEGFYHPRDDRPSHDWYGISASAIRFITDIKDYLRLLQPQAQLLLDFATVQPELSRAWARVGRVPELAATLGKYSTPSTDLVELLRYGFHAKVAALNTKRESD